MISRIDEKDRLTGETNEDIDKTDRNGQRGTRTGMLSRVRQVT